MIINYFAERLWQASSAPDNDVHDVLGNYANIGDLLYNSLNGSVYVCMQTGVNNQIWNLIATIPVVTTMISQALATLAAVAASGSYNDLLNKPTIPAAQIQSDWTQATTSALDYIKNKPAARSQSSVVRALNTAFQVNATRWSTVRYSVDISTTVSLAGSAVGTVFLETSASPTFASGIQILQQFSNGNSGTLVVGLVLTQLASACLSGDVPPGNYVRLRTANVTGTPTFTYQSGQEVLI